MNFNEHIELFAKKCFLRVGESISTQTDIMVYNPIIKPHFEFTSTFLLQDKAMRSILKCNTHLYNTCWMP